MTGPIVARVNVAGALKALTFAQRAAADLTDVMGGDVNQIVDEYLTEQFATEGKAGSTPWAPHSPVTRALRQRRGHGRGGIGRDTNRMWASLTKLGLGPDAVKDVTPDGLVRGTKVPYARFFAGGWKSVTVPIVGPTGEIATIVRRKVPRQIEARPIAPADGLPSPYVTRIEQAIADFIVGAA